MRGSVPLSSRLMLPRCPDHNDRKEQGEQKVKQHRPAQAQVDNQGDKRVENCAGNRHQRDDAGDKQHRQKDNQQNREDQGVHHQDDAQRGEDSLAALKSKIDRVQVAQQGKKSRQISRVKGGDAHERKDQPSGHHRQHAFKKVPQKGKQGRQLAVGAQDVGHPGVFASIFANVVVRINPRYNDRGADASRADRPPPRPVHRLQH